jgi:hypothetical protein
MSQWWRKIQRLQCFLWSFSLFHKKNFWDQIFCNVLLKIHIYFLIHHIFCIKFSWITKNLKKVYGFYQILHFILNIYLNFKFYENMLIIECFILLFHKLKLCLYVKNITPHLHVVKDFWNFEILFNRFLIKKFHNFQIVSAFLIWIINKHHLNFFLIKILLQRKSLI